MSQLQINDHHKLDHHHHGHHHPHHHHHHHLLPPHLCSCCCLYYTPLEPHLELVVETQRGKVEVGMTNWERIESI
ncbi:hypothetical protein HYC85_008818 [Camellia sinensis]|uniref:Uncharacterized protein n=1 Tax=Camellia sinensis TaxID=4442 RepID=A0A7J7HSY3_CAMSI|nr:hypothetical protein HYC85_008818 [Camellia sinensis]